MTPHSTPLRLLATLGALLVALAACAGSADAAGFGEVARFGARAEQGTEASPTKKNFLAGSGKKTEAGEERYAIGVDPEEGNAIFVLDEPIKLKEKEVKSGDELFTTERHVRIQKFSGSTHEAVAARTFNVASPEVEEEEEHETESFSNIAVDPARKVLYVLATEPRKWDLPEDKESPAATTLYAFKTEASGEELVPAEHTTEGVLAGPKVLDAESDEAGKPLLQPRGITIDPATGEVIILAHIDESGSSKDELAKDHFVLQRITDKGELGERYVDKKGFFEKQAHTSFSQPTSPVVSSEHGVEHVLVRFQGIVEIPSKFGEATAKETEPTQRSSEAEKAQSILEPGEEEEAGGALSLGPEGRLYEPAFVRNELVAGSNQSLGGIVVRSAEKGSLIGWSGGQSQLVNEERGSTEPYECVLEPSSEEQPLDVAAATGEHVFVLAREFLHKETGERLASEKAIVELGPGGRGCPTATGTGIDLSESGVPIEEGEPISTDQEVKLSTQVKQADAFLAEWTIENKATKAKVEKTTLEFVSEGGEQLLQWPELGYTFTASGTYLVTAKTKTDDLATPEVMTTKARTVIVDEPPFIEEQPQGQTVDEAGTATFTVKARGVPTPTVEWQVSTDKGVEWNGIEHATSDTLKVEDVTLLENGYEYRAVFKNTFGSEIHKALSEPAILTVNPKGSQEPPKVTQQPSSSTVTETETATFTAKAQGTPIPTIQWEVSTDGGSTFTADTTDAGNTSETLKVENATVADSGHKYRARFVNEFPTGTKHEATSNEAALTVSPPKAPEVTSPSNESVTEPDEATFTVKASGAPAPKIQWEVSTNGGGTFAADTTDPGNTSETLTIESTNVAETGREYRAKVTNEFPKGTAHQATSATATLTVSAKAKEVAPPGNGEVLGTKTGQTPPPPPPPTYIPDATVASASLSVSASGAIVIKITCPKAETRCGGTVTLRTLTAVSASKAGAQQAKAKRAILTLASGSFNVAAGATQAVTLHLSAPARKLLASAHTLRAKATVAAHDSAGEKHTDEQIVTLRLAKSKKR
jgi:hypothetical protein